MARRRRPEPSGVPAAAAVPAELTDPDHPLWLDPDEVLTWCRRRHLDVDPSRVEHGSHLTRLGYVAGQWAVTHDITRDGFPQLPDQARLRQIGVHLPTAADRLQHLTDRAR